MDVRLYLHILKRKKANKFLITFWMNKLWINSEKQLEMFLYHIFEKNKITTDAIQILHWGIQSR